MNAIHTQMPDAEYRAAPGLSQSALKEFAISPARYQASLTEPKEATPEMALGTHFHHLLLTPDDQPRIAVRPEGMDLRTKEGKAWKATLPPEIEAEIPLESHNKALKMLASIWRHPHASGAFTGGQAEVSVFRTWTSPYTGRSVQLKGRLDFVHDTASAIVDAKTCEDAAPAAFAAVAESKGYFVQAAYYVDFLWNPLMDALGTPEKKKAYFVIVAIEKRAPYDLICYQVGAEDRALYHEYINRQLERFAECEESGEWPGYATGIRVLSPPEHLLRRRMEGVEI